MDLEEELNKCQGRVVTAACGTCGKTVYRGLPQAVRGLEGKVFCGPVCAGKNKSKPTRTKSRFIAVCLGNTGDYSRIILEDGIGLPMSTRQEESLFQLFELIVKDVGTIRQQEVFYLCFAQDMSQSEIGRYLKLNQSSVFKTLYGNTVFGTAPENIKHRHKQYGGLARKIIKKLSAPPYAGMIDDIFKGKS